MKKLSEWLLMQVLLLVVSLPCFAKYPVLLYKKQVKKTILVNATPIKTPYVIASNATVETCSFYNCPNQCNLDGVGTVFLNGLNSDSVTFSHKADFRKSSFIKNIDFRNSVFNDTAEFTYADFEAEASFYQVVFKKNCHFVLAQINDEIDFSEATFGNVAFLSSLKFDTQLKGMLTFTQAQLPDTIDFSDNQFLPKQIEFADANFNDSVLVNVNGQLQKQERMHYIYLNRTDISKVHIDYKHFRLCLVSPFSHQALSNDEKTACYEGLLKSFKDHGQTESYEALDIEYKNWQSEHNFWMWLGGWWWNYGYAKGRVLLWTVGLLVLFSFLNVWLYDVLFETYKIPSLSKKKITLSNNYFVKGLQLYKFSFIYTTLIFSKLGIDFDKVTVKSWVTLSIIALEYLTGLLCTGFLVNWILSK